MQYLKWQYKVINLLSTVGRLVPTCCHGCEKGIFIVDESVANTSKNIFLLKVDQKLLL